MQFSALLVALVAATGAVADLHYYGHCYSHRQPIGNPNTCNSKRDTSAWNRRMLIEKRGYADNAAATTAACNAYRNRNTGSKQWDTCPDCTLYQRRQINSDACTLTCNSAGKHIGGDELSYYCKQVGADGSYAL